MKIHFLSLLLTGSLLSSVNAQSLKSSQSLLRFNAKTGLALEFQGTGWDQKTPLQLEIVEQNGALHWLEGGYSVIKRDGQGIECEGELTSPNGSHFSFMDRYMPDQDGFQLTRRVDVKEVSLNDIGFASRFGLVWTKPMQSQDGDTLMPGAWYKTNQSVPARAFASNLNDQVLMTREDRLGLPLAAFREPQSGVSLELERVGGSPTTIAGENGGQRVIDGRLQFGALGFFNAGHLQMTFSFPGSEDERPLLGANSPVGTRYLPRYHPVKPGLVQNYRLHFEARRTPSFAALVEATTKAAISRAEPPLLRVDLKKVYRANLDLLNAVTLPQNRTVSVPFQISVPDGEIKDTSMQMGFVGMALPCAALLLQDGLDSKNADEVDRAEKVINFWVKDAAQPSGVPKNWANFPGPGQVEWRNYPTHLRVASDGLDGLLRAWDIARRHQMDRPEWLQFARSFGDFLVAHQNTDGSWFGSWNFDGTPHDHYTNASTHPLEFLVDLSAATGDAKYRRAALRAGTFCLRTVNDGYSYVGGTPDNPNVTDKEAGVMAVRGFLALFDATREKSWLAAAKQAAIFCETWIYWRDLPVPDGDEKTVFPHGRSTVGLSLIATGHSASDDFMAVAPFWWYRIYLETGDAHFLQTARLLLHDTKQIMDWDGSLGYKYPGLLTEAMSLSTDRGQGVQGWLPWLSFVIGEPLARLDQAFGSMDIDEIEQLPPARRRVLSHQFSETRGFSVGTKSGGKPAPFLRTSPTGFVAPQSNDVRRENAQ